MKRREFLRATMVVAGVAVSGLPLAGCNDSDSSTDYFPQSVASGDPKPGSVILWTRVDPDGGEDATLTLTVATDAELSNVVATETITAQAAHDHAVKVKVVGLSAATTYYYRFTYLNDDDELKGSAIGRTKTAPAAGANATVKFASVVCQSYPDGYFNTYALMLEEDPDIDFFLHTGDYIYEYDRGTGATGAEAEGRTFSFPDTSEGAVVDRGSHGFAARSVENYRFLYRLHRSDSQMQRVHELFPMIVIWDDHEFSDDSHGATGTYFNGLSDETDVTRKNNAERVFFEYHPFDEDFDDTTGATAVQATPANDLYVSTADPGRGVWRDFRFGANFHLFMSDYRTFRPDHLIPEDAFPGGIPLDQPTLVAALTQAGYDAISASLSPYVDMTSLPGALAGLEATYSAVCIGVQTQSLVADGMSEAEAQAKAAADLSGNVASFVFNQLVTAYNATVDAAQQLPTIDDATNDTLPTGLSYLICGKTSNFTSTGSRYGVIKGSYDLLASVSSGGAAEDVLGADQDAAFADFLTSDAAFIALGSSVSTTSLIWDLDDQDALAPNFNNTFYANVDHYDGFPTKKAQILGQLQARGNAFVLSGDIHATFVTAWQPDTSNATVVPDFTVSSVSSTVFNDFVSETVNEIAEAGLLTAEQQAITQDLLVDNLDATLVSGFAANNFAGGASQMLEADTTRNGYLTVTVSGTAVDVSIKKFPHTQAKESFYDDVDALEVTTSSYTFDGTTLSAG